MLGDKRKIMKLDEFKDRLFDVINETDNLPIADIMTNDKENQIKVLLDDHTAFTVTCADTGTWFLQFPDRKP